MKYLSDAPGEVAVNTSSTKADAVIGSPTSYFQRRAPDVCKEKKNITPLPVFYTTLKGSSGLVVVAVNLTPPPILLTCGASSVKHTCSLNSNGPHKKHV